ncbi:MAG: hypothetical protein BM563_10325 [Bacteroidetes bacterium MedPE-SWsnd-G1]|nr:MAG: hypothetical protein BM563_10325 [Bacteroidetes bacterium MedPE-SWsnd-G1]
MIKFFRKIRQQLLNEGKTSKYFKYAIGEIVLVVIGILIALQINNWNQQRNNEVKLIAFIKEYRSSLKFNVKQLNREINKCELLVLRNQNLLNHQNLNELPLDTLENHIETFWVNYDINTTVIEKFRNSGITEFGRLDSIINRMQIYYGPLHENVLNNLSSHNDAVDKADDYWRYEQNEFEFKYEDNEIALKQATEDRKSSLIKLLNSPIARNILKIDNRRKIEFIKSLNWWKSWAEDDIKLINETLKTTHD